METDMNEDIKNFVKGVAAGAVSMLVVVLIFSVFSLACENSGYENKLVIQYHNPNREYDREMVRKMVNDSQVWTNFVCSEMKMDKWRIEWRMTNPKNYQRQGAGQ